jgi:prophage tail gpP-like protein
MIVGHKIERYLTVVGRDYGGHWEVTTHDVITELHATKGWRRVAHHRNVQRVRNLPSPAVRGFRLTTFERRRTPGRVEQGTSWLDSVSKEVRDRAVNRHKVRRVEIQRANNRAAMERAHAQ